MLRCNHALYLVKNSHVTWSIELECFALAYQFKLFIDDIMS